MYEKEIAKKRLLPAIRVEEELWDKVIEMTNRHGVSIAAIMRTALKEHFKAFPSMLNRELGHHDND